MYDPLSAALQAVSGGSASAVPLVFLAGLLSSLGPCAAPRLVAISGLTATQSVTQVRWTTLAFVVGLATAYASFAIISTTIGNIAALSRYIYLATGLALMYGGIKALTRPAGPACTSHTEDVRRLSFGATFLLGASFALVVSPCCTPIVMAILVYCTQIHSVTYAAGLLAIFAVGHALPLIGLGSGISVARRFATLTHLNEALGVVSGALMIALCGYYLCLA